MGPRPARARPGGMCTKPAIWTSVAFRLSGTAGSRDVVLVEEDGTELGWVGWGPAHVLGYVRRAGSVPAIQVSARCQVAS